MESTRKTQTQTLKKYRSKSTRITLNRREARLTHSKSKKLIRLRSKTELKIRERNDLKKIEKLGGAFLL